MNIKTKFNLNELVKHKYDSNKKDMICLLEVLTIMTEACYAGNQVFYLCRAIIAHKELNLPLRKEDEESDTWFLAHGVHSSDDFKIGWRKYREDELIAAPKEEKEFFNKAKKK